MYLPCTDGVPYADLRPGRIGDADHIDEVIASGTHSQRKALIEALVTQVKITGPGRIVPVLRIPQPTDTEHSETSSKVSGDRATSNLVGLTCQHPNPGWLADGPEITIRAVGGTPSRNVLS
jgi:hypothetical protein